MQYTCTQNVIWATKKGALWPAVYVGNAPLTGRDEKALSCDGHVENVLISVRYIKRQEKRCVQVTAVVRVFKVDDL
jgi:hypothetical protein